MSDFAQTYNVITKNEGGWAPPFALSGETYKGIDRKFFPSFPGWPLVDEAKPLQIGAIINNPDLEKNVQDFYFTYIGEIVNIENIINQTLADFVGDFIIHKRYDAVKVINATAVKMQPTVFTDQFKVTDQVIGLMTFNTPGYYAALYNNRIAYYQNPKLFGSNSNGFSAKLVTAFIERVQAFPATIIF